MMKRDFDVLVIGAGISGISAAYYLQRDCPNKTYAILEGRPTFGGTWDLFKYPGIRSDSDMYTLGFAFKPWTNPKAIADGPAIMDYLEETIQEFGIDKHIHFGTHVKKMSWSSGEAIWTVETFNPQSEETQTYTCNFISMCCGYYKYEEGFTPKFEGVEQYKGQLIHPQKWPTDLNYENKKIVVIGSGATAVTLIPALAKTAAKVTMLQRSPTYVVSGPEKDKLAIFFNKYLPKKLAYSINRWRKILFGRFSFWLARKYPNFMKGLIIKGVTKELGEDYDVKKHFTPTYNPWDQRICLVPDGDLFESLKEGKAQIVTDHIETFTDKGIQLKSGDSLEADIVVTATGLNLQLMGGIAVYVDDEKINLADCVSYKSVMFSNIPNLALAFGYTNASWTLKCDLSNQYVCRLVNYMDKNGYQKCCPTIKNPSMELLPWLDFNSSYILRHIDVLPKSGTEKPWILKHNYLFDRISFNRGKLDDDSMVFSKAGNASKAKLKKIEEAF